MASFGNRNQGFIPPPPPPPPPQGFNHNFITHVSEEEFTETFVHTPNTDLENQQMTKDLKCAKMELVRAAWKGDWEKAEPIINQHESIVREYINCRQDTALHIAIGAKQTLFIKNLVTKMERQDLQIQNDFGNTVLCMAAGTGNLKATKILVDIDEKLLELRNIFGEAPLNLAIAYRHRDIVDYLFPKTRFDRWDIQKQMQLLLSAIFCDYLDIAMKMVEKNPRLAIERAPDGTTALHLLARNPCVINSRSQFRISVWVGRSIFSFFKGLFYSGKTGKRPPSHGLAETLWKQVELNFKTEDDLLEFIRYPTNLLHEAARAGNVKLLSLMLSSYPDLIRECDSNDGGKSIFHVALENRQEHVFNLIHEIGGLKHSFANSTDKEKNNMLHLAAQLASDEHLNKVSGDALKMQLEVMWFKEVEKMVVPSHLEMENIYNQKPNDIFRKTHENLRRDGEKWMKDTTQNCMLVSTLIATIAFAAIFTIPGGNDQNIGIPILRRESGFSVFVISDVSALISSSTSMFLFLSILTSRYAEQDFLRSLPIMLLLGLTTMFISILSMVLAFGAAFFMLYDKSATWVPWTAFIIVFIPVTCFCMLQLRLWADVFRSTFWFKVFFGRNRHKAGFLL